jgi:hypothetical protein
MRPRKLAVKDLTVSNELATKALANIQGGASKSIRIRANIKGGVTKETDGESNIFVTCLNLLGSFGS